MTEHPKFQGYTFVGEETFSVGKLVELVAIYRNDRFADALELGEDQRDARAEFAWVRGGAFRMGLDDEMLERWDALNDETEGGLETAQPAHDVEVSSFLIARTTITQQLWDGLADSLGVELWDQRVTESPYLPVHGLTWSYFDEIAESVGLRLPSEAEWEYAAAAGSSLPFCWGSSKHGAFEYCWHGHPHEGGPMGVAQKKPNAFGLYDIGGNVWELCDDHWHDSYANAPTDSTPWRSDSDPLQRVMRGGSYRSETLAHLLCGFRSSAGVYFGGDDLGVRPVARL